MKRIYESITPQYQMDTPTRSKYDRKTAQSGRSMVETIGVLAVIGVLTIGGIAGYNYGINKYRANQVLQDIRLIYQETKYPNTVRQIITDRVFPDIELDLQSPYEYDFNFENTDDFNYNSTSETEPNLISVNVLGVSKTACDILLKTKPAYVLMLKANGQSTWNCTQDENKLSYIFEITSDSLEYGTCSVCTSEHCFDDDLNCPEGENCQNNVCSKCKPGHTENTKGECYKCSNITTSTTAVAPENCLRCDNTFILTTNFNTNCYSCKTPSSAWYTSKEHCESRCASNKSTVWLGTDENSGWCGDCSLNMGGYPNATREQCEKCKSFNDNIIFYPRDKNGTDNVGMCSRCNNLSGDTNSRKNDDGTGCICSEGRFWGLIDLWGECSLCTAENKYSSKTECDKCPQRYYAGAQGGNDRYGACKLCPEGKVKSADGRSCVEKPAS
ncbi:MAG: hypothetical protein IKJ28_04875 [Alphaproteobacteria bacterium]|nr:hypothetical protein [Alphaproteobacteria bacterium]